MRRLSAIPLPWLAAMSAVALLAACGSSSPGAGTSTVSTIDPPPPVVGPATAQDLGAVRQAAAHTLTLHAAISLEFASPPSVPYPPVSADGVFDLESASGQELVHDPLGTETIIFEPTRILDERPQAERAGLPAGRPWIRADFAERLKTSPFSAEVQLRLEQHDPAFMLAIVAWGATVAAPLGSRTVNGVTADGYRVQVNAARAAATASGPGAEGFLRAAAFLHQTLRAEMEAPPTVDVWVDGSHRVVSVRASTVGSSGGTTLLDLTSFGVPVRFTPPDASETVDLASVIGSDTDHD